MKKRSVPREIAGDFLAGVPASIFASEDSKVMACFGALFQGDHIGVEVATDSHQHLLKSRGLLLECSRLSGGKALAHDLCVDGLCIDDYFAISREDAMITDGKESRSYASLMAAKDAYREQCLLGSDDKDVIAQDRFKVIGAEVISDVASVSRGTVVVGAPFEKRLGLAALSAEIASKGFTSDALHATLVGSWISVLTFRRPAMAIANDMFGVIPPGLLRTDDPQLWPLPSGVREELQLLAVLAPILCSNVAVPFLEKVYATDASMSHGGIASADVPTCLAQVLWRTADRKGENVPILPYYAAMLHAYDEDFDQLGAVAKIREPQSLEENDEDVAVPRPLGLHFQFLEICGGAGKVTRSLIGLGAVCGPVFDLSNSAHYNLVESRVLQWIIFMLESDRLQSFLVAPPCTSVHLILCSGLSFEAVLQECKGLQPK